MEDACTIYNIKRNGDVLTTPSIFLGQRLLQGAVLKSKSLFYPDEQVHSHPQCMNASSDMPIHANEEEFIEPQCRYCTPNH